MMEWFSKTNLFVYCGVAAILSLTSYLAAFSIEISWLLEAKGNLPTAAYLLCAGYFTLFVASTTLIHGLATRMVWGLLSWSAIIIVMSIPELILVFHMITQHWGLQSTHGLTELISYLIRLLINSFALLCVIPTALKWRHDKRVRKQLESLANRLQLTTPLPDTNFAEKCASIRSTSSRRSKLSDGGFDNPVFLPQESSPIEGLAYPPMNAMGSENEFNASIFGLNPSLYIGPPISPQEQNSKRTQSLLDLRFLLPSKLKGLKDDGTASLKLNNNSCKITNISRPKLTNLNTTNQINEISEPFYQTIDALSTNKTTKCIGSLGRNCVSLENLGNPTTPNGQAAPTIYRNDLNLYGNNLLQNYAMQWQQLQQSTGGFMYPPYIYPCYGGYYGYPPMYQQAPLPPQLSMNNAYYGPYNDSRANSKQSLRTNSTDDFRKYRDVAL